MSALRRKPLDRGARSSDHATPGSYHQEMYHYPPDKQAAEAQLVMQQAEPLGAGVTS
jgi:hypothetical protein